MASKKKLTLRQDAFDDRSLMHDDAMERLHQQSVALYQLNSVTTRGDPEKLNEVVDSLDFDLVHYALSSLRAHLLEAAVRDGASLIAESILDTSVSQKSAEFWERWLTAAPCWPLLAKENWYQIAGKAADIVVSALEEGGTPLDGKTRGEIKNGVYALRLPDLLPQELVARVFPGEIAGDEAAEQQESLGD